MAVNLGPLIVTERLELWQPAMQDRAALHEIVAHGDTKRFLGPGSAEHEHFQRFARNAGSWFLYGYGGFTVRLRESGEVIGNCGLFHSWRGLGEDFDDRAEAGWIVRHDQVGRGLAQEAMDAAIGWFEREHGAREMVCMIAHGNDRSFALATRLGFRPMRDTIVPDGDAVTLLKRPATAA
jgi:RimJ/RimL family protein N-acetyltransferase